jgi:hypothetical protein
MFVNPGPTTVGRAVGGQPDPRVLAARIRPLSAASDRLVPVLAPLAPLFPDRALRRGTTVVVAGGPGQGATTLALALLSAATASGHWAAVVGLADPGVVAVAELGVDLGRVVFSPRPRAAWADAVATLLDGVDLVLVRPPGRTRPTAARHLVARTRERQGVLVVLTECPGDWPEGSDLVLVAEDARWRGVGRGYGYLQGRRAEVRATARRSGGRAVRRPLWLPAAAGDVADPEIGPPAGDPGIG